MLQQVDGSYRIQGPGPANVPIPMGDVQNDFGKCVKAVIDSRPGLYVLAVGEMLSWGTILETWCKSQGVPSSGYEEHTIESFVELLPGELTREVVRTLCLPNNLDTMGLIQRWYDPLMQVD